MNSKWGVPYPELHAYRYNEKGHGMAWCIYCCRYHYHGNTTGHKNGHCDHGSPYKGTGYVLIDVGDAPEWMQKDRNYKTPLGMPARSDGQYVHYLPTLTCGKSEPIIARSRRMTPPRTTTRFARFVTPMFV